jgi:hypothetical protein
MKPSHRIFRLVLAIVLGLSLILVVGGLILSRYARNEFDKALSDRGITISSLRVNLFNQSITIRDFSWTQSSDSLPSLSHHVKIEKIFAGGIGIYALLKSKRLDINTLHVSNGDLVYNTVIHRKSDAPPSQKNSLQGITIEHLKLDRIGFTIVNDTTKEYSGTLNLAINDITLDSLSQASVPQAYTIGSFETSLTNIRMNARESMYRVSVTGIHADSRKKNFIIDSVVLLPKFSKYAFSRKLGKQVDRFVLRIPKIDLEGFAYDELKDSVFTAALVNIRNANLHVYRDKRLPFIKDHNMPLPVAMIRALPFTFAFDSIKIIDSKITYQEFPEKGFQTGHIVFEKLNASIDHISNRKSYPNYSQATIKAKARVMGNGQIDAQFSLPYSKAQIYNAKGTISNLSLPRLNPILESLAFIKVETGRLNQLYFNFDYDDIKSNGSILINYEDLKLTGLTKEKDSDKNEFKTWVLNMFLKRDKDKSVSKEKRTGIIEYERDRRRALFNVWVKSLMSGVKSSVLDSRGDKEENDGEKEKKRSKDQKKEKESDKRKA